MEDKAEFFGKSVGKNGIFLNPVVSGTKPVQATGEGVLTL